MLSRLRSLRAAGPCSALLRGLHAPRSLAPFAAPRGLRAFSAVEGASPPITAPPVAAGEGIPATSIEDPSAPTGGPKLRKPGVPDMHQPAKWAPEDELARMERPSQPLVSQLSKDDEIQALLDKLAKLPKCTTLDVEQAESWLGIEDKGEYKRYLETPSTEAEDFRRLNEQLTPDRVAMVQGILDKYSTPEGGLYIPFDAVKDLKIDPQEVKANEAALKALFPEVPLEEWLKPVEPPTPEADAAMQRASHQPQAPSPILMDEKKAVESTGLLNYYLPQDLNAPLQEMLDAFKLEEAELKPENYEEYSLSMAVAKAIDEYRKTPEFQKLNEGYLANREPLKPLYHEMKVLEHEKEKNPKPVADLIREFEVQKAMNGEKILPVNYPEIVSLMAGETPDESSTIKSQVAAPPMATIEANLEKLRHVDPATKIAYSSRAFEEGREYSRKMKIYHLLHTLHQEDAPPGQNEATQEIIDSLLLRLGIDNEYLGSLMDVEPKMDSLLQRASEGKIDMSDPKVEEDVNEVMGALDEDPMIASQYDTEASDAEGQIERMMPESYREPDAETPEAAHHQRTRRFIETTDYLFRQPTVEEDDSSSETYILQHVSDHFPEFFQPIYTENSSHWNMEEDDLRNTSRELFCMQEPNYKADPLMSSLLVKYPVSGASSSSSSSASNAEPSDATPAESKLPPVKGVRKDARASKPRGDGVASDDDSELSDGLVDLEVEEEDVDADVPLSDAGETDLTSEALLRGGMSADDSSTRRDSRRSDRANKKPPQLKIQTYKGEKVTDYITLDKDERDEVTFTLARQILDFFKSRDPSEAQLEKISNVEDMIEFMTNADKNEQVVSEPTAHELEMIREMQPWLHTELSRTSDLVEDPALPALGFCDKNIIQDPSVNRLLKLVKTKEDFEELEKKVHDYVPPEDKSDLFVDWNPDRFPNAMLEKDFILSESFREEKLFGEDSEGEVSDSEAVPADAAAAASAAPVDLKKP